MGYRGRVFAVVAVVVGLSACEPQGGQPPSTTSTTTTTSPADAACAKDLRTIKTAVEAYRTQRPEAGWPGGLAVLVEAGVLKPGVSYLHEPSPSDPGVFVRTPAGRRAGCPEPVRR